MKSRSLFMCVFAVLFLVAAGAPGMRAATPVPCSALGELRDQASNLIYLTNPSTGDKVDYVVIGDAAASNDVLVMFPGTGEIIPDWPLQMITNSTYSPNIVDTLGYRAIEDGPISLCHNYRLLFFDYPGVGENFLLGHQVTKDDVSSDVDAILTDAATQYGISTNVVDPLGWSLGTTDALKFSLLSAAGRPSRTIHNIVLIATDPGGYTTGLASPNEASCVDTLFAALKTATDKDLKRALEGKSLALTFPYMGQTAKDNGTNSGCTATITNDQVQLSVTPICKLENNCKTFVRRSEINRLTLPWSVTRGIDHALYLQQRAQGNDWAVDYCAAAGPGFNSIDCTNFGPVLQSVTNGGICETDTTNPNLPVVRQCANLTMTGTIAVLNGFEDLFVQWTYGRSLVDAYNRQTGAGSATLTTYPGKAGHAILIEHPLWTQTNIQAALTADPRR